MLYYALFQDRLDKTGFASIYEALELIHKEMYSYFKQEISGNYFLFACASSTKNDAFRRGCFAWT